MSSRNRLPLEWAEYQVSPELQITRENFEAECKDADKILALFPDLHRTPGGRLPVAKLVNAICDLAARCKIAEARGEGETMTDDGIERAKEEKS